MAEPELMDLLRDAALKRDGDRSRRRHAAAKILLVGDRERMGSFVDIDVADESPTCFVGEVVILKDRDPITRQWTEEVLWAIAVAGKRVPERFYNLDCALLAIVAFRHNGANMNDRGWSFAARALGVSMEES